MLTMVATMPMMANTMTMRAMMVPMVVSMMFFDGHFFVFRRLFYDLFMCFGLFSSSLHQWVELVKGHLLEENELRTTQSGTTP